MKNHVEELIEIATAVYVKILPSAIEGGPGGESKRRRAAVTAVEAAKILIEEIDKEFSRKP